VKVTKNHQLIPINEMKDDHQINLITNLNSNNQLYCQMHKNEEIKLFCDDCKLPICLLCVDQHTSHKIFTLSNIVGIEKQLLMDLINQVCFLSFLFFSFLFHKLIPPNIKKSKKGETQRERIERRNK